MFDLVNSDRTAVPSPNFCGCDSTLCTVAQTLLAASPRAQGTVSPLEFIDIIDGRGRADKVESDLPDVLKGLRRPEWRPGTQPLGAQMRHKRTHCRCKSDLRLLRLPDLPALLYKETHVQEKAQPHPHSTPG